MKLQMKISGMKKTQARGKVKRVAVVRIFWWQFRLNAQRRSLRKGHVRAAASVK